jgi:S-(hydroxymethyl)glutathione dehydrogenase/alcohol dehydrogenase
MKAAVLREIGKPIEIAEVAIGTPGPREVLIRTRAVGLCHSDLHVIEGVLPFPLPTILGHESAGVVEAVGSEVRTVKVGDHVVTCLSTFCGHCEHCLSGNMARCSGTETRRREGEPPRLSEDGQPITQFVNLSSFAEQMLVHEHACTAIRRDMPFDRAALIGCAVVTGVGAVIHTANVRPGETVAVIGCGGVGLSCINGAAITGAGRIIAIDTLGSKLNLAKEFGATDVIDARAGDPVEQVLEMTKGGVHHAFEAIGLKATCEQAFKMLMVGGTATIIGLTGPGVNLELPAMNFFMERRIQGSRMGSNRFPTDMPRYVDFYLAGKLKLDQLVSQHLKLADINRGFEELKKGEIARSVILFDA